MKYIYIIRNSIIF